MEGKFSTARYARLAARYKSMTITVPMARERGSVVLGSFTSSEANVTSCHESAANSDPDWETQNTVTRPRIAAREPPGCSMAGRCQKLARFACTDEAFQPTLRPSTINAPRAPSLATVNEFWMILPYSIPRALVAVSKAITSRPTNWAVDSVRA